MATNRSDIVLVKLAAVFVIVFSLQSLSAYGSYIFGLVDAPRVAIFALVFNFLIPVLLAGLLWYFPATLAGLAKSDDLEKPDPDVYQRNLLNVGIFLIGLYALVFGIIDLLYFESLRWAENVYAVEYDIDTFRNTPETTAGRITNIAQIIFGASLIAGRRGIAQLFYKIRHS